MQSSYDLIDDYFDKIITFNTIKAIVNYIYDNENGKHHVKENASN